MFKNLFFQTKALPELSSQLDIEIPRYPPFLKGLPAASPEDLQSTQDELIAKLRQVLGFNLRDFLNRCATGNKDDPFSSLCSPESNFQRMT